ncbi:Glutamate-ammonia-ligase adenylyltransferase [Dickeya solani]|nr:Glutamate-ammonia-ligase adenylyltransferase [Dickeya solani]
MTCHPASLFPLSAPLTEQARHEAERLLISEPTLLADEAVAVLICSEFVSDALARYPEWRQEMVRQPPQPEEWRQYADWLSQALSGVSDETALMQALRLFRRRILTRIAWGQWLQLSDTGQTLQQLSVLAEALIVAARQWLYDACCREWARRAMRRRNRRSACINAVSSLTPLNACDSQSAYCRHSSG